MRRLSSFLLLFLLAVPTAALAVGDGAEDGTLAVSGVSGSVSLATRGALIGQIDHGWVRISDPNPNDGRTFVVWGYESRRDLADTKNTKVVFSGADLRFRISGGFFRVKVVGTGVDLSIVGRGSVSLAPVVNQLVGGTFSLNEGPSVAFPEFPLSFQLDADSGG